MKDLKTKDVALVGLFAALMVICAWISIPLGPVPVTLQTFAVFLAAALLGSKRGTLAVGVYILLGVVGLPVFSGFKGLNPLTFGYVLGFLPLGMLTAASDKLFPGKKLALPLGMVMGLLVCYLIGTVWFYYVMHFRGTEYGFGKILSLCVIPFILPDLVKLGLAWFLSLKLKKFVK
jgi:biotin transport system substrate-specific component